MEGGIKEWWCAMQRQTEGIRQSEREGVKIIAGEVEVYGVYGTPGRGAADFEVLFLFKGAFIYSMGVDFEREKEYIQL